MSKNIYDITVLDKKGNTVSLADYKGQVLLIINTASRCGFTPQYDEIEALYERRHAQGLEILDFPCNQFGNQAPESDEELTTFCQLNYKTKFPQFKKVEVNGDDQCALFRYLKEQKGFEGFDKGHQLTALLEKMFDEQMPGWRESNDIKWNFTKFLVSRDGEVLARFEPTHDMGDVERQIEAAL